VRLVFLLCLVVSSFPQPVTAIECFVASYGENFGLDTCPRDQPYCFTMSYRIRDRSSDIWQVPDQPCLAGCGHWTWRWTYPEGCWVDDTGTKHTCIHRCYTDGCNAPDTCPVSAHDAALPRLWR